MQTPSPCLLQSYEDVGQAAFGDSGRAFITAVLYTELIGTCALFFILEASHTVSTHKSAGIMAYLHSCLALAITCFLICHAAVVLYFSVQLLLPFAPAAALQLNTRSFYFAYVVRCQLSSRFMRDHHVSLHMLSTLVLDK